MPLEEFKQNYFSIATLYDMAEELVDVVEQSGGQSTQATRQAQIDILEPFVEDIGESTDILTEEFAAIAEHQGNPIKVRKGRVEGALRKLFSALDAMNSALTANSESFAADTLEAVGSICQRIRSKVEDVIGIFMEFVRLSLDRIMHKWEVEELRKRNERISYFLHQQQLQQGTPQAL